jgi:TetR/AcrR family transcriptional regulator
MAISDRKKREKEYRKQSIIDAAEKLFFEKGYDNVSMNDIAGVVELNRATIYLYFENKEALCFAVILRGVRILNEMVKVNVRKAHDNQKINAMGKAYYTFFQLYPQYFQVYTFFQSGRFELSFLRSHAFKDVNEIIRLQKELFDLLHLNIKEGIKKGRIHMDINGIRREGIRHDIDSFYATSLVLSTIESMLNPPPFLEKELKDRDIDKYQFETILMRFVNRLLVVKD